MDVILPHLCYEGLEADFTAACVCSFIADLLNFVVPPFSPFLGEIYSPETAYT